MIKVDKIIPCICCNHEPNSGDSVYYGMSQLKVCGGKPYTYFEVYCPKCGRDGSVQFKSAYLALKHWNEMQERFKRIEKQGYFIGRSPKECLKIYNKQLEATDKHTEK